ncbi:MAG: hypothetical protein GY936_08435 [Ignavibacteriae bacterium]|nr:hypothetical protein [Ignavibacteriota bacterium]
MRKIFIVHIVVFITAGWITAQEVPELNWKVGGTVQAMVSAGQTGSDTAQVGFGVKRTRLKASFNYGNVSAYIQYSPLKNSLRDARMTYKFTKAINVRVGRFIGASVRAGGLTGHTSIDLVERALSAQKWSTSTLGVGGYRDYGVSMLGNIGELGYTLSLANGHGGSNVIASQKTNAKFLNQEVSIAGMVNYKPKKIKGLEVGGYYGIGNANINKYSSFNAYVYWEPKPIRVKAEVISVTNENDPDNNVSSMGYYVMGAFGFAKNWEAIARYEAYDPTDIADVKDKQTLITIGARYALYPNNVKASKITFAYVMNGEEGDAVDNDTFYVMFQTAF